APQGMLVLFQDADAGALGEYEPIGAAIKGTIRGGIIAQGETAAMLQYDQNEWVQRRLASASDEYIRRAALNSAVRDAQGIESPGGVVDGRLAIALQA